MGVAKSGLALHPECTKSPTSDLPLPEGEGSGEGLKVFPDRAHPSPAAPARVDLSRPKSGVPDLGEPELISETSEIRER